MTELHVIETGEVVESMTPVEAERITSRIADKLDAIADNLEQVLPLISEALTRDAWQALGYASPTAYVSERFAGALTRLAPEIRRPVVAELSAAGMSTRAISPVVGVSQRQVSTDVRSHFSPDQPAAPSPVTGMDGKTYARSAPSAVTPDYPKEKRPAPQRSMAQNIEDAVWGLKFALRVGNPHTDLNQSQRDLLVDELETIINTVKGETP